MTVSVKEALERVKSLEIFNDDTGLYFIGGTALAYYLDHRISEDIDIISIERLPHKEIISMVMSIGGIKLRDENAVALRMAGLVPDEYMLKFNLDGVKLEFFRASTPVQIKILKSAKASTYLEGTLNILDVKSIAKLKLIALLSRNKSRDLFDFKVMLEESILTAAEILEITIQTKYQLETMDSLYKFVENIEETKDDEVVYLNEEQPINLSFEEIKLGTLQVLKGF